MWQLILLFIALTPGILVTIPPVGTKLFKGIKGGLVAACVHAVIFVLLMRWLTVDEGFQTAGSVMPIAGSVMPILTPQEWKAKITASERLYKKATQDRIDADKSKDKAYRDYMQTYDKFSRAGVAAMNAAKVAKASPKDKAAAAKLLAANQAHTAAYEAYEAAMAAKNAADIAANAALTAYDFAKNAYENLQAQYELFLRGRR